MTRLRLCFIGLAGLLLAACATAQPTSIPTPTEIAQVLITDTPVLPTVTATALPATDTATPPPTATATAVPPTPT
ncbi:MAG: hypothetical protein KC443_20060, partial [Anaerolineales bacterium]|nr:hypothetical protein [Anaerolineales bacterium]